MHARRKREDALKDALKIAREHYNRREDEEIYAFW
jgi:hypothetical protein